MKSLVFAVTTLVLAGGAVAQTAQPDVPVPSTEQQVENAAKVADQAAEEAADAAVTAVTEAGAVAENAADEAADAAAIAGDAAVQAAKGVAEGTAAEGEAATDAAIRAAEEAADAADKAAASASVAADAAANDSAASDSAAGEAATEGMLDADTAEGAPEGTEATGTEATGAEAATTDAALPPPVIAPDVNAPAISEAEPGVLSSWVTSRNIWTTNQPSTTVWVDPAVEKRPGEWQNIAKVNDIVLDDSGEQVVGYIADIGGFLGIGAKKVLLGPDAIHLLTIGGETFFATHYTKEELEALPDFDEKTVRK